MDAEGRGPALAALTQVGGTGADAAREWSQVIAATASREGYFLEGVFSDVRGRTESGLYALVEALSRGEAVAVIVPDLSHLRHAGCLTGTDAHTAARYLQARVLTTDRSPMIDPPPIQDHQRGQAVRAGRRDRRTRTVGS